MPVSLDDNIHAQIKRLCAAGDDLAERQLFSEAVSKYNEALAMLPEPTHQWDAAAWIYTAIGDAFFHSANFPESLMAFTQATNCPNGVGNPFVHLRLGQIQLELGNEIIAADELTRAYMGAGKKIFDGEPPKYFELLRQKIKEPPAGW